jgi:hypothetical protein
VIRLRCTQALCSRVGIMVGGRFQCLGSVPRLKQRFSTAVRIEMRCRPVAAAAGVAAAGVAAADVAADVFSGDTTDVLPADTTYAAVDRAVAFVLAAFPGARVDERHGAFVRFEVPTSPAADPTSAEYASTAASDVASGASPGPSFSPRLSLAHCFRVVEGAKAALCLEDYSVGQGSLEQVFIRFAKGQDQGQGQGHDQGHGRGQGVDDHDVEAASPGGSAGAGEFDVGNGGERGGVAGPRGAARARGPGSSAAGARAEKERRHGLSLDRSVPEARTVTDGSGGGGHWGPLPWGSKPPASSAGPEVEMRELFRSPPASNTGRVVTL